MKTRQLIYSRNLIHMCIYDDIFGTDIIHFENYFVEFFRLLNLVTNET